MSNNKGVEDQNVAYGVASIVCSALSWIVLGIVLAPLGVVFGCIGLTKGRQSKVLSAIGLAIGAVALAVIIISFIAASTILTRVR